MNSALRLAFGKSMEALAKVIIEVDKREKADKIPDEAELIFSLFYYTPKIVEYSVYYVPNKDFYVEVDYYDNGNYTKEIFKVKV
jgi:hypothetical protein